MNNTEKFLEQLALHPKSSLKDMTRYTGMRADQVASVSCNVMRRGLATRERCADPEYPNVGVWYYTLKSTL